MFTYFVFTSNWDGCYYKALPILIVNRLLLAMFYLAINHNNINASNLIKKLFFTLIFVIFPFFQEHEMYLVNLKELKFYMLEKEVAWVILSIKS